MLRCCTCPALRQCARQLAISLLAWNDLALILDQAQCYFGHSAEQALLFVLKGLQKRGPRAFDYADAFAAEPMQQAPISIAFNIHLSKPT